MPNLLAPRALAERLSHRLVFRRRLPRPFDRTSFYVSSEGGLKYLRPGAAKLDPVLIRLVEGLVGPGDVVWDIGANVGLFTFSAASAAGPTGRVVAVEPDTRLVELLRRSLRLPNRRAPVEILPVAIGARTGVGRFCIAVRNRSTSHLAGFGTSQTGGVRSVQTVPMLTLDVLLEHFPAPDILKIDVEGAECDVLAGGRELLERLTPTIICEVLGRNAAAVSELLTGLGYRIMDGALPLAAREPLVSAPLTTVAIPPRRRGAGADREAGVETSPAELVEPRAAPEALHAENA